MEKEIEQKENIEETKKQEIEQKQDIARQKQMAQQKYKELISSIRILSHRAQSEDKNEISEKLNRISRFLEEVKEQRTLCMVAETDRIERKRYEEILDLIYQTYDGSAQCVKEICNILNKRTDIDEVLRKYDSRKSEKSVPKNGEER